MLASEHNQLFVFPFIIFIYTKLRYSLLFTVLGGEKLIHLKVLQLEPSHPFVY